MSESPQASFECALSEPADGSAWVHVRGELDIATVPKLEQVLRGVEERAPLMVVDLRGVTFIDSSGVRTICDASLRVKQVNRRMIVVPGDGQVDRLFALTGARDVLEMAKLRAEDGEDRLQILGQISSQLGR